MWGLFSQMDPEKIKYIFLSGRVSSEVFQTDAHKAPQKTWKMLDLSEEY